MHANARKKNEHHKDLGVTQQCFRSAIANGSRLVDGLDGRPGPARRYRDLMLDIGADLGGFDHLPETQKHLIRTCAGLTVLREALDTRLLNGEAVDSAEYTRIANSF